MLDNIPFEQPWHGSADANMLLNARFQEGALSLPVFERLRDWNRDGYLILKNVVDSALIDQMNADMESIWSASQAFPSLGLHGVPAQRTGATEMLHEELVGLSQKAKDEIKTQYHWRVHAFHRFSSAANNIFHHPFLRSTCSLLFNYPAIPTYNINFVYGSEQELHQDSMLFHVKPFNMIIGVWIACEDVTADAGPLEYYPGSHLVTPYHPFMVHYPYSGWQIANEETRSGYREYVAMVARQYKKHTFIAKKGDVLLWNGMLLHGGGKIITPEKTRRSFVSHFIGEGMDKASELNR